MRATGVPLPFEEPLVLPLPDGLPPLPDGEAPLPLLFPLPLPVLVLMLGALAGAGAGEDAFAEVEEEAAVGFGSRFGLGQLLRVCVTAPQRKHLPSELG